MTADENPSTDDCLAAGATVLGFVSLATCWWYPFGLVLGGIGAGLGAASLRGNHDRGRALVGTALAATGAGAGLLLGWDSWLRVFGW